MGIKVIKGSWEKIRECLRDWQDVSERTQGSISDALSLSTSCSGDSIKGININSEVLRSSFFYYFLTISPNCSFLLEVLSYAHLVLLCCSFMSLVTVIPISNAFPQYCFFFFLIWSPRSLIWFSTMSKQFFSSYKWGFSFPELCFWFLKLPSRKPNVIHRVHKIQINWLSGRTIVFNTCRRKKSYLGSTDNSV